MNYEAVLRVKPMRFSGLASQQAHQNRTQFTPNADPARQKFNRVLIGSGDFAADLQPYFDKYKKADKRGNDFAEVIVTAHQDYFNKNAPGWQQGKNLKFIEKWVQKQIDFMEKRYPGCIASAVLHMDESSPHIHFNIVPLSTFTKRFRRGEKEVTQIYYNNVFGDSAQTIALARTTMNSEMTKLGQLQTAYGNEMKELGLVRGTKNSRATHKTISEFYKLIMSIIPGVPVPPDDLSLADKVSMAMGFMTENASIYKNAMDKYYADVNQRTKIVEAKAKITDTVQEQLKVEKQNNINLQSENDKLHFDKSKLLTELTYTKDQLANMKEEVAKARNVDLRAVANLLHYTDSLTDDNGKPKWRNAIDMLKDVGGLDYVQAVNFLFIELQVMAPHHVSKYIEQNAVEIAKKEIETHRNEISKTGRPLTKPERVIVDLITKQLDAYDCPQYRITLQASSDKHSTYTFGRHYDLDGNAKEEFFSKEQIISLVPKLLNENMRRDYNIYVTPIDPKFHYVLIDDVKPSDRNTLVKRYSPCSVTQTSPEKLQMVIKVASDGLDRDAVNEWFKQTNREVGDPKIVGLIHPFRLAGFTNRKPKYEHDGKFPFVRLLEYVRTTSEIVYNDIKRLMDYLSQAVPPTVKRSNHAGLQDFYKSLDRSEADVSDPKLADFCRKHYKRLEDRFSPDMDYSRADWMLARELRARGHAENVIGNCILYYSPHLDARHPDYDKYVARTVLNSSIKTDTDIDT